MVINAQPTMIRTLCINMAWCCGEPIPCVLRHFVLSILLHCPIPTVRSFPLLAGRVPRLPRLPRWPPFPQGPRTPPPHRPLHLLPKFMIEQENLDGCLHWDGLPLPATKISGVGDEGLPTAPVHLSVLGRTNPARCGATGAGRGAAQCGAAPKQARGGPAGGRGTTKGGGALGRAGGGPAGFGGAARAVLCRVVVPAE